MIRQLKPSEKVQPGDLVSKTSNLDDGFRPLQGFTGLAAGEYSYPIYREDPKEYSASGSLNVAFTTTENGAEVQFTIEDTDPESTNDATTTLYNGQIRQLAEWLTKCAEAMERAK